MTDKVALSNLISFLDEVQEYFSDRADTNSEDRPNTEAQLSGQALKLRSYFEKSTILVKK